MIRSMLCRVSRNFLHAPHHLRRVVGQVQEQGDTLHTAVLLEVLGEEAARLQVDTHGTEDDREVVVVVIVHTLCWLSDQAGLSANLRGDLVMRQTGRGEDGNLLATGDRVHRVNGGDTGRDHLLGIHLARSVLPCDIAAHRAYSRVWVDGTAVDVEVVLRKHLGALVDGLSGAVENATQHVLGDTELQAVAGELDFGLHVSATSL
jgi:hypothetical protein